MEVLALYVSFIFAFACGVIVWRMTDALLDRFGGSAAGFNVRAEQMHSDLMREIDQTYHNAM